MYYEFPTYIDDKGMIPVLLDHDWMCYTNGTWTVSYTHLTLPTTR